MKISEISRCILFPDGMLVNLTVTSGDLEEVGGGGGGCSIFKASPEIMYHACLSCFVQTVRGNDPDFDLR